MACPQPPGPGQDSMGSCTLLPSSSLLGHWPSSHGRGGKGRPGSSSCSSLGTSRGKRSPHQGGHSWQSFSGVAGPSSLLDFLPWREKEGLTQGPGDGPRGLSH